MAGHSIVVKRGDPNGAAARRQTSGNTGSGTPTVAIDPEMSRRRELAEFLKAKRAAIAPASVGLRPGPRRRAAGLLREEVAQRADISAAWYAWLEQGREINPSADVLEHLADALLLNDAERAHLMTLARPAPAARDAHRFSRAAPSTLIDWLEGLQQPAYAVNGIWDVLAWNRPATDLLGDFARVPAAERNILRMIFLWPDWRRLFLDRESLAASCVAQFRADTARYAGDEAVTALTAALARDSEDFALLWRAHDVDAPRLRTKRLRHPRRGVVEVAYAPLQPKGAPADISVVIYSPAWTPQVSGR